MRLYGSTLKESDKPRLNTLYSNVKAILLDGNWWTVDEVWEALNRPKYSSVERMVRYLRDEDNLQVFRRDRDGISGNSEYKVKKVEKRQLEIF